MHNDTGHQLQKFDRNRITNSKMADKWRPCKGMAVSQAFIFHFKWYSLLHFAVCQLLCWAFLLNRVLNLKSDCSFHQQRRFQASFLSGDITRLNQLGQYIFGHVARASPEDDRLKALLAGNEVTCGRMEISKRTH